MPNVVAVRKLLGESRCSVSNAVSHQKGDQGSEGYPIDLMNKDRNAMGYGDHKRGQGGCGLVSRMLFALEVGTTGLSSSVTKKYQVVRVRKRSVPRNNGKTTNDPCAENTTTVTCYTFTQVAVLGNDLVFDPSSS